MTQAQRRTYLDNLSDEDIQKLSDQELASNYKAIISDPKSDGTTVDWLETEIRMRWLKTQGLEFESAN